jgi:metal-dependent HD superfamily phosphatase/phosphodiesterase
MKANNVQVDTLSRDAQVAWAASLNDIVASQIKLLNDAGYRGNEIVARYYELLKENGVEPVRDWNMN